MGLVSVLDVGGVNVFVNRNGRLENERATYIDVTIDEMCEMLRVRKLEGRVMEEGLEMGVREVKDGVMEGLEKWITDGL